MLKKSLLIVAALVAAFQSQAAPVDAASAKAKAQQYLVNEIYAGKFMAPAATEPVLIKTEMGKVNQETPVFYIFNTSTTFVVVSGDDRAEEILVIGDQPLDLNRFPDGLKEMLSCYTEEIDWLLSNPDAQVEKPVSLKASGAKDVTYGPLLTCNWDQTAPYYNQCKFTYNGTSYQCLTGCPATSASMVMYFWKWPTAQVAAISSYTEELNLSYYNSVNFTYPALSATTFDWANMKDTYNSYTTAQGNAVATLMRYVGQAEKMQYGTESAGGSGILTTKTQQIVDMFTRFGYDSSTTRVVKKTSYSESSWATLIQNEMAAGRPIVFMAVDESNGGHAFNVDGYRDSDNKYHVNFGWSGSGNAWCVMNSFGYSQWGTTYTFNSGQQAVIGIKPTSDYFGPMITTSEEALTMEGVVGQATTSTFTVTGSNLTGNVTLTVSGTGFSVSPTTISASEAAAGKTVTVTYNPTAAGTHNGTITLKSTGATNKTVSLTGTAKYGVEAPVLNAASDITETGFTASWTHNASVNVTYTLEVRRNGQVAASQTGITAKNYTVTGLTKDQTYTFRVKAVPVNTTNANESNWSNTQSVTLTVAAVPTINTTATALSFDPLMVGQNSQKSFTVTGTNLEGNITAALTDANGVFALNTTSITPAQAQSGKAITVTFTPKANVAYQGTITLTSANAQAKTITLTGSGEYADPVMLAADENHININSFRADWTDATPAANVESYTLEVNYVAPEPPEPEVQLLHTLLGTDFTGSATGYYDITLTDPWGGVNVRGGLNSIIYIKNNYNNVAQGYITYTIPEGYQNQTFTLKITSATTNDATGNVTVSTPQTSAVGHNFAINETYAWKVTASSGEKITITTTESNYSPDIAKFEVYSGDATGAKASETGDETQRTVTGITNKYYDVANLIDEGTYTYKVKAIYSNGSESNWSNIEEVTLFGNATGLQGDVNGDGEVNVVDITALIDAIMNDITDNPRADVNGDGNIDVVDITALIDIIMNS